VADAERDTIPRRQRQYIRNSALLLKMLWAEPCLPPSSQKTKKSQTESLPRLEQTYRRRGRHRTHATLFQCISRNATTLDFAPSPKRAGRSSPGSASWAQLERRLLIWLMMQSNYTTNRPSVNGSRGTWVAEHGVLRQPPRLPARMEPSMCQERM